MIVVNRMKLGRFGFAIKSATFRYITQSWSGPGWDFNIIGKCLNPDPEESTFLSSGVAILTEAAPLPFAKADDYTGVTLELPEEYDEATGEPYFSIDDGEGYEVWDVHLRFVKRDRRRYLIEMSGIASEAVLGHPERFELLAWVKELPDHAYPT